jgi:hypothetical protein
MPDSDLWLDELIGEEQAMAPVCETFDRVGKAFAPKAESRESSQFRTGEAEKRSERRTVFHQIIL